MIVLKSLQLELNRIDEMDKIEDTDRISHEELIQIFKHGKKLFNEGLIHEAHIVWEMVWKEGDEALRKEIKGFIQLSGGVWNNKLGKGSSTAYLFKKSIFNLEQSVIFKKLVNIDSLVDQIAIVLLENQMNGTFPKILRFKL